MRVGRQVIFNKGDIVRVNLNPTAGREKRGDYRPCLVITEKNFNKLGTTFITPITQGGDYTRVQGLAVTLMGSGTETQGVILVSGLRAVDLVARKTTKIETAPKIIMDEVIGILTAIIEGEK